MASCRRCPSVSPTRTQLSQKRWDCCGRVITTSPCAALDRHMAQYHPDNPCIVQSDHTILVEVHSPHYPEARDALARFAELVKSPEHVHTYRITPLSIWNACAAGMV